MPLPISRAIMPVMKRLFAIILPILLLSACAVEYRLPGPPVSSPVLDGDRWQSEDGAAMPVRMWLPAGSPRAVILALHGMNDYSNAFDEPGKALAKQGIVVYAYDQRGFGKGPHPGYWSSGQAMAADLRAAIALVATHYPGVPLYLLGESMGGAVAILATAGTPPPQVAGLILSAPAVWSRESMGIFQRAALWLAYEVAPGMELTGQGLHIQASDNIEMLRKLSKDPLVLKATRVDAVAGLVDLMDEAALAAPFLHLPTLLLYGEKDQVIPAEATRKMIGDLKSNVSVALYPEGWHLLLRDLQAGNVLNDIAAWTANPANPLPSGADAYAQSVRGN